MAWRGLASISPLFYIIYMTQNRPLMPWLIHTLADIFYTLNAVLGNPVLCTLPELSLEYTSFNIFH